MRGRKPKPTALRDMQGGGGHRPRRTGEPRPNPGIPACPDHLSSVARTEWDRITNELSKVGLLTQVDSSMLAAYCSAYGRWVEAEKLCAKGIVYKNGDLIKINPAVRMAHDAMNLMKALGSEFGMSPASRTRLQTAEQGEDEMESFLRMAQ